MRNSSYMPLAVGVIFLIIGLYILVNPVDNMITLSILFSIVMLLGGISELISYFNSEKREFWLLINGLITIVLALWLLSADDLSKATLIPNLLALWVICTGVTRLIDASVLNKTALKNTNFRKSLVTLGGVSIVVGLVLWIFPGIVATIITLIIAAIFIFQGVFFISTYMKLK